MSTEVSLVPVGVVPNQILQQLSRSLETILDVQVQVGRSLPLPEVGYNPKRDQYRGEAFLELLRSISPTSADRLLGVTDVDCYAAGLNFVFGQAISMGREAFIALPRLRPSFYGLPEDSDLYLKRIVKEAVHELGHTWGLAHCPNRRCVMTFSNSLHDTDIKKARFCATCKDQLAVRKHN